MKESKWSATRFRAVSLLLLIGALSNDSFAAPGDVDLSFDPGSGVNGTVQAVAVQPDGKLIIVGQFSMVKGLLRLGIARLHADGSGDASFDAHAGGGTAIDCVALQPDGKVLIGGFFITVNNVEHNGLARLNADGSVDSAFNTGSGVDNFVYSIVLQPDGKLLIGGYFTTVNGVSRRGIARLNNNGTLDTSFNPGTGADGGVYTVALQSDGKVLIGGNFSAVNGTTRSGIARLNANGSLDTGFNPGASGGDVWAITLQSDGKMLAGGAFTNIAGATREGIARLNANGSLDGSFNPVLGSSPNVDSMVTQPDGDILIGGRFSTVNGASRSRIARLNANGSLDDQFNPGAGADDTVRFIALQPNGKVMIAGAFTNVAGIPRTRIARLNADGSLDTSFHSGTQGLNFSPYFNSVASLIPLSDGKLLVGLNPFAILGWRPAFIHGTSLYGDARLNADGSRDTNFVGGNYHTFFGAIGINPDPNHWIVVADTAHAVSVQSDGKVVIAGTTYASDFEGSTSEWFPFLQRANADGSVDGSFNPTLTMDNSDTGIFAVATPPGGKVYVGGIFRVDATNHRSVARLNSGGSLDTGFQAVSVASGQGFGNRVYALAVQSDGKVLIGGPFSVVNGTVRNGIARLNANGTLDTTFNPGTGTDGEVWAIAVQPDGNVLIGGSFINFNGTPRKCIARLNPNGSLDNTFNAGAGPNATVRAVALQPDGQVLIGGDFLTVNGVLRTYVARLHGDSPAPSLNIARSNAFVIVSWPVPGTNFRLEENTNLSLSNGWSAVGETRSTNNNSISMALPATGSRKFFRLSSP